MSKVVLFIPGNATHSFLTGDRWDKMANEELGLHAIGASGIPVTVSHQGLDYELYPFLTDVLRQYPSISVANTQFGHALMPFTPSKQQRWEVDVKRGNVPVTFFSEFYSPEANFIPTEFFFYLRQQTFSYSMMFGVRDVSDAVVDAPLPADAMAVNYAGHTGLIMDGFQKYNKAWFAFAADPSQEKLACVMAEFRALTQGSAPYVVVPMDLEQPYVGSIMGQSLWTMFFNELKRQGLDASIAPMQEMLEPARQSAIPIKRPHRILTKWTVHELQIKYLMRVGQFQARTRKALLLYSLASSSDLLSSWNRFVLSQNQPAMIITCKNLDNVSKQMVQGYNKTLQEACLAACSALEHGDAKLANKLESIQNPNGLTKALHRWASNNGL